MSLTLDHLTTPPRLDAPRIADVGFGGILVTFSDVLSDTANNAALAFRAAIDALALKGVIETSTSLTSTFVSYDPLILARDELSRTLQNLVESQNWGSAVLTMHRKRWLIPAVFGGDVYGPQLKEASELAGVTPERAVAEICSNPLRVLTLGFAPGQPYLGSLPAHWDIPRQSGLTKRVPVGAITVAIRQIVLFAASTPTGWRQVGACGFQGFRPQSEEPFAFSPGDEVLFRSVEADEYEDILSRDRSGSGGATWEALS